MDNLDLFFNTISPFVLFESFFADLIVVDHCPNVNSGGEQQILSDSCRASKVKKKSTHQAKVVLDI